MLHCRKFVPEGGQTHHQACDQDVFCRCSDANAVLGLVEEFNRGHAGWVNAVGCRLEGHDHDHKTQGGHRKTDETQSSAFGRGLMAQGDVRQQGPNHTTAKRQHRRENMWVDVMVHVKMADQYRVEGCKQANEGRSEPQAGPVSYTHLTLPTKA